MSDKPQVADKHPIDVDLQAGRHYLWCACGRSEDQPFCDGSHAVTDLQPIAFSPGESGEAWLCMCKQTKNPPYCDGSHKCLKQSDDKQWGSP